MGSIAGKIKAGGKTAIEKVYTTVAELHIPRPKFDTDWLGETSSENEGSHTEYCAIHCSECAHSELMLNQIIDNDSEEMPDQQKELQPDGQEAQGENRYLV